MKYLVLIFLSSLPLAAFSQDAFYNHIPLGKYSVGFCDTVIYDKTKSYDQYGCAGNLPVFVQIWHPLKKQAKGTFLRYGDFRTRELSADLQKVYSELNKQTDLSFIEYNLSYECVTGESLNLANHSQEEVLEALKLLPTKSLKMEMKRKRAFPVIVFHHGSQAASDDCYFMAEYFASRGYIVVSANFHLPYPGTPFGLLPYDLEMKNKHDQSTAKAVIDFAKTLTNKGKVFFVGHSWGAQEGWCFLHEKGWTDAFVSMETTLEFKEKSDSLLIKERWPLVYEVLKTQNKQFALPILLFADTQLDEPFHFFAGKSSEEMLFVSPKAAFDHESFNATFLMRYFVRDRFPQSDESRMKEQLELYAAQLQLMDAFFHSVQRGKSLDRDSFKELFYIN